MIPPARGRGVCTNAVQTLTSHLFASGVRYIVAEVNPGNTPSIHVLERTGFRRTVYKEKAIEVNGVWLDGVVYELRR